MLLRRLFFAGLCIWFAGLQAFAQNASCTFTFFQLPTTQFEHTFATGINRFGTVVGWGCGQETPNECLGNRGLIRLSNGSLKTVLAPNSGATTFNKRNASGVTVGESIGTAGRHHGIVYYNGTWRTVDYPAATGTALTGINKYGSMVGTWTDSKGKVHSFKLKDGKFTTINFPGSAETRVASISDTGVIVGTYETTIGGTGAIERGFVLANSVYQKIEHPNGTTALSDINASGTMVGDNDGRPFILKNKVFYDVVIQNTNSASIRGINGYGAITGTAFFGLTSKGYVGKCQ